MLRQQYRDELKKLKAKIEDVFNLVIKQSKDTVKAIKNRDRELAQQVIENDNEIDKKVIKIEEQGIQLAATQFPVAKDLRLIHSVLLINMHLERIGDLAYNSSKGAVRLFDLGEGDKKVKSELVNMGNSVVKIIEQAKSGFVKGDIALVEELPVLDEKVDDYFKSFLKALGKFSKSEHSLEWYSSVVLIARYFERMADQAVSTGRRAAFILTGKKRELKE